MYRLPDGQPVGKPLTGEDAVIGLSFDDEGKYLAMGRGQTVEIWDAGTSEVSARSRSMSTISSYNSPRVLAASS